MKKIIVGLVALSTISAHAQFNDSLVTKLTCYSGYGDADTHYVIELQEDITSGERYLVTSEVGDGEWQEIDSVSVVARTTPTGITTYANLNNTYQARILRNDSELRVVDRRSASSELITFNECEKH